MKATAALSKAAHVVESELEIEHIASGSILRAIAADGDVQHGKTPYFVLSGRTSRVEKSAAVEGAKIRAV